MAKGNPSRLVIRHKALECIGCCLCAETIPQYFEMDDDGMAVLTGGLKRGVFHSAPALALDQAEIDTAIEGCPVDIIRVDST
jgi:ferredoxin